MLPPDRMTKEIIFKYLTDEEIFERFLGIPVVEGELLRSPLREDSNPTCSFKRLSGGDTGWWFTDWGGSFSGNCFHLVKYMYGVGYGQALDIIANEFNLWGVKSNHVKLERKFEQSVPKELKVKSRGWIREDLDYWKQFGISQALLTFFRVKPVQTIWLGESSVYTFRTDDLAYWYNFNFDQSKIYFPFRKKYRFLMNTNVLQGYNQLPEKGNILIITKSLKDIMVLYNFGISAIAPQSESQCITQEQYLDLSSRFNNIYCLYDFDLTGVRTANKMKRLYGIKPIFLTNGRFKTKNYGSKDVSDLFKNSGRRAVHSLLSKFEY